MNGSVIWITGLSGAGKTTLSLHLIDLLKKKGYPVVRLDGDELREVFGAVEASSTNHGRDGRLALAMKYAKLCQIIAKQGFVVVIATISLFKEVHAWNRSNLPGYYEVYLKVPIDELRKRDPKELYKRFDNGEIAQVAGLDLSIDEPEAPDWVIMFDKDHSIEFVADELLKRFNGGYYEN